jgi:hypothetical protein
LELRKKLIKNNFLKGEKMEKKKSDHCKTCGKLTEEGYRDAIDLLDKTGYEGQIGTPPLCRCKKKRGKK